MKKLLTLLSLLLIFSVNSIAFNNDIENVNSGISDNNDNYARLLIAINESDSDGVEDILSSGINKLNRALSKPYE